MRGTVGSGSPRRGPQERGRVDFDFMIRSERLDGHPSGEAQGDFMMTVKFRVQVEPW